MKQILIMMMVLVFAISLTAEVLNINTSQQNYEFELVDIIGLSFDDESMMLETSVMTYTFLFDDILFMEFDTVTGIDPAEVPIGAAFLLNQNYPNPFNPSTNIDFAIPSAENVKLTIYDIRGRQVKTLVNQPMNPGHYLVIWNGKNDAQSQVSSGVYFYRIKAGDFVQSRKMILVR